MFATPQFGGHAGLTGELGGALPRSDRRPCREDCVGVTVESTQPAVRSALHALFDLMHSAGAIIHPGLRIAEDNGQISVFAEGDAPWLMRIPRSTLVPVECITWSDEPPLRLLATPGHFTALQVAVLEACRGVMASAETWEHFRATHPRATITDPEAIDIIQALHPAFSPAPDAGAMLKTRTIKLSMDDAEPVSYLMPLLDLVNHHSAAPAYTWDDNFLCIPTWRADASGECFVSYGSTRDVLGIALAYGYVDENITRVNTLSGSYPLSDGSMLNLRRSSHHRVINEGGALTIEGAAFDPANPQVEVQTLREPTERFLRQRGVPAMSARHSVRVISRRIAASDIARLTEAQRVLTHVDGAALIVEAMERQASLVTGAVTR